MLDIVADRIFRPLYRYQILVFAGPTFQKEVVKAWITFVLVTLDEVPPLNKVFRDVLATWC